MLFLLTALASPLRSRTRARRAGGHHRHSTVTPPTGIRAPTTVRRRIGASRHLGDHSRRSIRERSCGGCRRPPPRRRIRHLLRPVKAARSSSADRGDEPQRLRRGHAGNHEFDWGLGPMRQAISGAAFPYVSATSTRWWATRCSIHRTWCCARRGSDRCGRLHHAWRNGGTGSSFHGKVRSTGFRARQRHASNRSPDALLHHSRCRARNPVDPHLAVKLLPVPHHCASVVKPATPIRTLRAPSPRTWIEQRVAHQRVDVAADVGECGTGDRLPHRAETPVELVIPSVATS